MELCLNRAKERFESSKEGLRYLACPIILEKYRGLMNKVYIDDSLSRVQNQALVEDNYLFGMLQDGAISLGQFMQQANDKIRLMTLEAQ